MLSLFFPLAKLAKPRIWLCYLWVFLLSSVAIIAAAGDRDAKSMDYFFDLSLQELSQIKVTIANRVEENFVDAPSSVTVITGREVERMGVRTLTELLNYVPGFQSLMSPHESNRSMILARGLPDIYGRHILLMVDGHRINGEYTGGFSFADHLLGLKYIKQIEFIRGPGSALYGSNALSGVINIITGKRKAAEVTVGSNNSKGVAGAGFGELGGFLLSGAVNYYTDHGESYFDLVDKNGFGNSTRDPRRVLEGRFALEYSRTRFTLEYMKAELEDYYVFRRINDQYNENNIERIGMYLEYDFDLPERWSGYGRIGYMRHKRDQRTLLAPTAPAPFIQELQQDTREAQLDFNYLTESKHQLSIGAYIGYMSIPRAIDSDLDRFVLDESRRTAGLYLQDQFDLADDLRMTAGLRYDNYSDFGNSLNPRLAMLYRWRENDSFKLMYGRAYRAPSLGDLYDLEGTISGGNLFLKPVTVNTFELAYLHTAGNNSLNLTWFFNDYSDFITTRTTTAGQTVFDNVYGNRSQGLELDVVRRLNHNWSSRASVTHVVSSDTDIPPGFDATAFEDLAPRTYGSLVLNYHRPKWNWNVSAFFRDRINVLRNDKAIAIVNSKLMYRLTQKLELGFNIRNLFDHEYSTPQNQPLGQDRFGRDVQEMPSRGRELFLTLRYDYAR